MSSNYGAHKDEVIARGNKNPNHVGTLTFVGLRLFSPVATYGLLAKDWGKPIVQTLRGSILPQGPSLITNTPLDRLGLSPYRSILFAMSIAGAVKQQYWATAIMQERLDVGFGTLMAVGNNVMDIINTLLFVCAQTSASVNGEHFPQTPLIVGSALYVAGMALELISEQQRHNWKKDPAHKGQVYSGGLFSLSRHINYLGNTMWRAGYTLASGGWLSGLLVGAWYSYNFTQHTIPRLTYYMRNRYGENYTQYEKKVPYIFVPYLL